MSNHWCAVCGHANSPGAEVCEACDARLGDVWGANAGDDASAGGPDYANEPGHANAPGYAGEPGYAYDEAPHSTYGEAPHAAARASSQRRFKGVGDVFGPTLEVYRKNFLLIITLVVVATTPSVILQLGLFSAANYVSRDTLPLALAVGCVFWLMSLAGSALLSGALVYAVMDLEATGATSAGSSLLRGLKSLPKVFAVQLVYSIVVLVGFVLLIVPGIILMIVFALVVPVAVAEGRGTFESFGRSMELTGGYKGLIFLTYFLWIVAVVVIHWIIGSSFAYGAGQSPFVVVLLDSLVAGVLNSSTAVLTVFIYLGVLNERADGFGALNFTHNPASGER